MFNGHRISVLENESVLEMDGGDGCTTVFLCLMPLNYTPKMVKIISFRFCIFYNNKNEICERRCFGE